MRRLRRLVAVLGSGTLVAAGFVLLAAPAQAAIFTVNTAGDAAGVCPATCTLRAAITAANAAAGDDQIVFSVNGTITLATGALVVNDPSNGALTISGNGTANTIIDAATLSRVIDVTGGDPITLQNLTIQNGNIAALNEPGGGVNNPTSTVTTLNANFLGNVADGNGGAINASTVAITGGTFDDNTAFAGGAIQTNAVTVTGATFTANVAGGNRGGAIVYSSTLTVDSSVFGGALVAQGNTSNVAGGAIATISGSTMTVTNSTFQNNVGNPTGGALYATANTAVSVTGSTFVGNSASITGGAISIEDPGGNAALSLTVERSTFQSNRTTGGGAPGGAIAMSLDNAAAAFTGTITNNTFDANQATGVGATVWLSATTPAIQSVTLRNNTITGGIGPSATAVSNSGGTVTLAANIISGNANTACAGTMTDGGSNLVFGDAGGSTCPTGGTNITGQDPLLGALQVNAPGATATRAITSSSPAYNAVVAGCPPPATDQRGITRPQSTACDIGAYEVVVSAGPGGGTGGPGSAIVASPQLTG